MGEAVNVNNKNIRELAAGTLPRQLPMPDHALDTALTAT